MADLREKIAAGEKKYPAPAHGTLLWFERLELAKWVVEHCNNTEVPVDEEASRIILAALKGDVF